MALVRWRYLLLICAFVSISYLFINQKYINDPIDLVHDILLNIDNQQDFENYDFSPITIYGEEEYCNLKNQQKNGYNFKTGFIMGLYNTGTNVLLELLMQNCWGKNSHPNLYIDNYTTQEFYTKIRPKIANFESWRYMSLWNITFVKYLEYIN